MLWLVSNMITQVLPIEYNNLKAKKKKKSDEKKSFFKLFIKLNEKMHIWWQFNISDEK
jgi:hypothetical protein